MVFDSFTPKGDEPYWSHSERLAFANSDTLEPPPNTYLWLGPFGGRTNNAMFYVSNHIDIAKGYRLHVLSGLMNQVVFKFVTANGVLTFNNKVMNQTGWHQHTRRFWPLTRKPFDWPPTHGFSDSSLQSFTNAFSPSGGK